MVDDQDKNGITAYHGSPYDFEQFDTSKIGTGEGAQAYGHGLYFAEHEPVAKGYRDRLGKTQETNGETIADQFVIQPHFYKDISEDELNENMEKAADYAEHKIFDQGKMKYVFEDGSMLIHDDNEVRAVQKHPGHMYEVHIDAHPDHFLDWDKPLSEQPFNLQQKIYEGMLKEGFDKPLVNHLLNNKKGSELYNELVGRMQIRNPSEKSGPETASNFLKNSGIQGIKYLDQQSRDKKRGTRNYVVFDDKRVKVKRRYAEGGDVESETIDLPHSLSELKDWKKTHPLRRDPNFFFTKKESLIEGEPPIAMPANLAEVQAFSKKRADGGKVDKYPLARGQENHLTEMAPDQFLNRARPLKHTEENRETINDFKKAMKKGHKLDPLALYPHNQENGRHRATAAKELGIKKVPVHDYRKRDGGAIVKRALMIISKKA